MLLSTRRDLLAGHKRDGDLCFALRGSKITQIRHRQSHAIVARTYEAGIGMFGTKKRMEEIFTEDFLCFGSTVIEFEEGNIVAQVKTKETDGYDAVQVGYRVVKERKVKKPVRGHLAKYNCPPMKRLREFKASLHQLRSAQITVPRVQLKDADVVKSYEPGQQLKVEELFKVGDLVDVAGKTIGKGFQGTIKRWGHKRGPKTHGSKSYRAHGSIGSGSASPSRVFPGMKMAGRMGNKRQKIRKLEIMKINAEAGYMIVKGSVPGKPGGILEITPAKIVGVNV